MRLKVSFLAIGFTTIALSMPSHASYVEFFGEDLNNSPTVPLSSTPNSSAAENDFLSILSGVGTEDFESFSAGETQPLDLSFPGFGSDSLDATLDGAGRIKSVNEGSASFGRYSISGTNTWRADASGSGGFSIAFAQDIAAFGFYGVDIGDFGGQLQIDFQLASGDTLTREVGHTVGSSGSTDGSVFFYGFATTDPELVFTGLNFDLIAGPATDIFSFDNMTIGELGQVTPDPTPVPAPATLLLMATGLFGVYYRRTRSRS